MARKPTRLMRKSISRLKVFSPRRKMLANLNDAQLIGYGREILEKLDAAPLDGVERETLRHSIYGLNEVLVNPRKTLSPKSPLTRIKSLARRSSKKAANLENQMQRTMLRKRIIDQMLKFEHESAY